MQRHLLMEQLTANFKQSLQLSQDTLTEICLLEAVVPTHLRLVCTHTLEGENLLNVM